VSERISEKLLQHHKRRRAARPAFRSSVPYLSRSDIELKAEEVLEWIKPGILAAPSLTPVAEIAERMKKEFDVRIEVKNLGFSARGRKILGACQFSPRAIQLDALLDPNGPRYRFTFAHEIGHLILHRKLKLDPYELDIAVNEIVDEPVHFYFGRKPVLTGRDRLEWQANAFASALLMPRATVKAAVVMKQQELGIRRLGTIYVDNQPRNMLDYIEVRRDLVEIYQVSNTALRIRLKQLQILEDRRRFSPQHISTLLRED
jgi:hypothetical protein